MNKKYITMFLFVCFLGGCMLYAQNQEIKYYKVKIRYSELSPYFRQELFENELKGKNYFKVYYTDGRIIRYEECIWSHQNSTTSINGGKIDTKEEQFSGLGAGAEYFYDERGRLKEYSYFMYSKKVGACKIYQITEQLYFCE